MLDYNRACTFLTKKYFRLYDFSDAELSCLMLWAELCLPKIPMFKSNFQDLRM